ncbi:hypothetical protein EDB84DRAFT_1441235 [Lactarius hengduanensis]|nr:hypothetical protein EDB84DRAFT_1441235 [Lactarius hengduanensis]
MYMPQKGRFQKLGVGEPRVRNKPEAERGAALSCAQGERGCRNLMHGVTSDFGFGALLEGHGCSVARVANDKKDGIETKASDWQFGLALVLKVWEEEPPVASSEEQSWVGIVTGMTNPCGSRVGLSRVRVRVAISYPSKTRTRQAGGSESIIVIIAAAIQLIPNLILVAGAAPPPPPYPGHRSGCGHPCSRRYVVESSSSPSPPVWLSPTLVAVWGGGLVAVVGHNVGELGWLMYTRGGHVVLHWFETRRTEKRKEAYLLELATSAVGCLSAPCVQSMGGCKVTCEYPLRPRVRAMGGGGGIAFVGKEARKLGLSVGPASRGLAAISDSTSHDGLRSPSIAAPSPISFADALLSPPSQPRKWAMTTPISRKLAPGSLEDRPHVLTPRHFFPWPSDLVASPYLPLSPSLRLSNASGSPPFVFGKGGYHPLTPLIFVV